MPSFKSFILKLAQFTQKDYEKRARDSHTLQLLTISLSHYVELSRWALQLGGIRYEEHSFAPVEHVLPVISARIRKLDNQKHIKQSTSNDKTVKSNPTGTPYAILPDGSMLSDSWSICAYSGLQAPDEQLKNLLDKKLGVLSRHVVYSFILQPKNSNIFSELCLTGRSFFFRLLWYMGIGMLVRYTMCSIFKPFDTKAVDKSKKELIAVVEELDVVIRNRKGKYIGGDDLSTADIAIAALLSPMLANHMYNCGRFADVFNKLMKQDTNFTQEVKYFSESITGMYAMQMYYEHRLGR